MKRTGKILTAVFILISLSSGYRAMAAATDIGGEYETEILDTRFKPGSDLISNAYSRTLKSDITQAGLVSDEIAALYSTLSGNGKTNQGQPDSSSPELASLMIFGIGLVGLAGLARKKLNSDDM